MLESFEKVPVTIYKNPTEGSNAVARQIADLIKEKQKQNYAHRPFQESDIGLIPLKKKKEAKLEI